MTGRGTNDLSCASWQADLCIASRSRAAWPCLAVSGRCLIAASACCRPCLIPVGSLDRADSRAQARPRLCPTSSQLRDWECWCRARRLIHRSGKRPAGIPLHQAKQAACSCLCSCRLTPSAPQAIRPPVGQNVSLIAAIESCCHSRQFTPVVPGGSLSRGKLRLAFDRDSHWFSVQRHPTDAATGGAPATVDTVPCLPMGRRFCCCAHPPHCGRYGQSPQTCVMLELRGTCTMIACVALS